MPQMTDICYSGAKYPFALVKNTKMGEGGQKYKFPGINKSWGCNVQHGDHS